MIHGTRAGAGDQLEYCSLGDVFVDGAVGAKHFFSSEGLGVGSPTIC